MSLRIRFVLTLTMFLLALFCAAFAARAASVTTLSPLAGQLICTFTPQSQPAKTLFAGLAPGLTGIYQASFQMPSDAGAAPLNGMYCSLSDLGFSAGFGFGVISVPAPVP